MKVLDFDSAERWLVFDLDMRNNLILGIACLERQQTWIDWRFKTVGTMRNVSDEASKSH